MTVSIGDVITASQYNTLKDSINKWYGDNYSSNTPTSLKTTSSYGWGGVNAAAVTTGEIISADQTNHLINRINQGSDIIGSSSTTITKVSTGGIVLATKHNEIETNSALIDSNRFSLSDHTTTSGGTDDSEVRGSWSNAVSITATATFASYANARYFFNSGGQLRISFDNTGTGDDALAWDDLWSSDDMGTLIFSYNDIAQTGTRAGNFVGSSGFYELTTTPTEIYNINLDESPYTSNDFRVNASRNSTGTQVILTFTMNNDDPQAELVDGNTACYLDHRIANSQASSDPTVNFSVTGYSTFSLGSWSGS